MDKIYICSQYSTRGSRAENLEMAKLFCRQVIEEGKIPICPHVFYGPILDDDVPAQRTMGLLMGLNLLEDCRELRIYSRLSEGMKGEILKAAAFGIPVSIGNLAAVHSEDQAAAVEAEIVADLEELYGKEHHSTEN